MDKSKPKKGENPDLADPFPFLENVGLAEDSTYGDPSWEAITREITARRPLIAKVGIHYILIIGYNGESKTDKDRTVTFIDPLVGVLTLRAKKGLDDTDEAHFEGGFPTGGEAASKPGFVELKKSDIKRESFVGYLPTKGDPPKAGTKAATKAGTKAATKAAKKGGRRLTRRFRR